MSKLFLSGGVGDVLLVESYIPRATRQELTHLYLASRPQKTIKELFENHPNYPQLEHIEFLWDRFDDALPCFVTMRRCVLYLRSQGVKCSMLGVEDWSIARIFSLIRAKALGVGESRLPDSSFMKRTSPGNYGVVHPYTGSIPVRSFLPVHWQEAARLFDSLHLDRAIVLGAPDELEIPEGFERVETGIQQAIDLTANAGAFVGVDSSLCVVAGYCLPPERLKVYTNNGGCFIWRDVYFPLQREFTWLKYDDTL